MSTDQVCYAIVRIDAATPTAMQKAVDSIHNMVPDRGTLVAIEQVKMVDKDFAEMDGGPVIYFP